MGMRKSSPLTLTLSPTRERATSVRQGKLKPHSQVVFTELADGTGVLLHLTTKFFFSLNPTSTFLWKLLAKGNITQDGLVKRLVRRYNVSKVRAQRDVDRFLTYLVKEKIIVTPD